MKTETYNGWTNYATWRVNLELIDGWGTYHTEEKDFETFESVYDLSNHLKDYVESYLEDQTTEGQHTSNIVLGYAMAFLSDVNWYEIAEHIAEDYPQIIKSV